MLCVGDGRARSRVNESRHPFSSGPPCSFMLFWFTNDSRRLDANTYRSTVDSTHPLLLPAYYVWHLFYARLASNSTSTGKWRALIRLLVLLSRGSRSFVLLVELSIRIGSVRSFILVKHRRQIREREIYSRGTSILTQHHAILYHSK